MVALRDLSMTYAVGAFAARAGQRVSVLARGGFIAVRTVQGPVAATPSSELGEGGGLFVYGFPTFSADIKSML